jgi:hypothetical protein
LQLPRNPFRPPKRSKREASRPSSSEACEKGDDGSPGRAGYAALGLLFGAVFLVPLGLPFEVEGAEVLLVFSAALVGAFGPDVAAPEGPGAFLRTLFRLLGLGRKAEFLTASSRLGAGGVRATHCPKAAAIFAVGCAGLFALGPAGGSAWAAATFSYAAHLWRDSATGRHEPDASDDAVGSEAEGERNNEGAEPRRGRPGYAEPRDTGTGRAAAGRHPGAHDLFRRLAAKLPGPPAKKRRRRKKDGGRGRKEKRPAR